MTIVFANQLKHLHSTNNNDKIYLLLNPNKRRFVEKVETAISLGFSDPVLLPYSQYASLTNSGQARSLIGNFTDGVRICMNRSTDAQSTDYDKVRKQLEYALATFHHEKCQTKIVFDHSTLDFLRYHTYDHQFEIGDKKEQREISGIFKLVPISPDLVQVQIDHNQTKIGDSEKASHHESLGTFHTHPKAAYQRHRVCVAFPSGDDFATTFFLYASEIGTFHVLSAIEGIYVITVKPSFARKHPPREVFSDLKKWEKYVFDRYDIGYPECSLQRDNTKFWKRYIGKYLKKINRLKVFDVQFHDWDTAHEPFDWVYHKILGNCVTSDQQFGHLHRFSSTSKSE